MSRLRDGMRRRPVAWFFGISLALNILVVGIFVTSGAAERFAAAVRAAGLGERTDFVSAFKLALAEPASVPGIALSILQPLTPDIAAFVVAGLAFGLAGTGGVVALVRRYRFWSRSVGWRRGLRVAPPGSLEWLNVPLFSLAFPLALLVSVFLDVGGVTEETGWRGFALPMLQERMTPLAATIAVGLMWGIWHFPARPDLLFGAYGLGGGAALLGILLARFLFLSVVMTYFYNRVGGSTLIAIAMHGLHNDAAFLQGRIVAEGLGPYVISELTLLAPIVVVAVLALVVSGRGLGLVAPPGRDA